MAAEDMDQPKASSGNRGTARRALAFGLTFFLVILAYYQVKPASRSLFLDHLPASALPYLWIASALTLGLLMPLYQRLLARVARWRVVLGSVGLCQGALILFWLGQDAAGAKTAVAFSIFVDIMSVLLVEQLWSAANTSFRADQGKRWYGLIGSGGLLGGMLSGGIAAFLLKHLALQTGDLLLVSVGILGLVAALISAMVRQGLFSREDDPSHSRKITPTSWTSIHLLRHPYIKVIAGILLTAQLIAPIVEYQFLSLVAVEYPDRDDRTAYLSGLFSMLSGIALLVNLVLVPLLLRQLGTLGGLLVQPLAVAGSSLLFMASGSLPVAAAMKICDRGLSYSVNRVSRELLYTPIDGELIYRAKAWIDMFGYRLFRILGSVLIKLCTAWLPVHLAIEDLSWISLVTVAVWLALVLHLVRTPRLLHDPSGDFRLESSVA